MINYLLTTITLSTKSTNSVRNANRFPELGTEEIVLPLVVTRVFHGLHKQERIKLSTYYKTIAAEYNNFLEVTVLFYVLPTP